MISLVTFTRFQLRSHALAVGTTGVQMITRKSRVVGHVGNRLVLFNDGSDGSWVHVSSDLMRDRQQLSQQQHVGIVHPQ